MSGWATAWVQAQMMEYRIRPKGFAGRFAASIAWRATAVAELGMVSMHTTLAMLGLNAAPLGASILIGTIIAVPVAALVSFVIAFWFGGAIQALAISRDEFERLSATDLLSGLANRRAFFQHVEDMQEDAALAVFDIDRFKRINDTYGHMAGDEVIRGVARILERVFAEIEGAVGRLGGEEFAVLLRAKIDDGHLDLVDKARVEISQARIAVGDASPIAVTVSAGVAERRPGQDSLDLYRVSDKALYCAKAAGRNCVVHERDVETILAAKSAVRRRADRAAG